MKRGAFGLSDEALRTALYTRLRSAGHELPQKQTEQLLGYLFALSTWNERINLTALREADAAVDRLIVEPVLASRFVPATASLLDIGSGSGSPAIPLKVSVPGISLVMVEVKARKCAFLREAARQLGLPDVQVESRRFEQVAEDSVRKATFDVVSVRAVRTDAAIVNALSALLRPGGRLLMFRTDESSEPQGALELEANVPLVESSRSRLVVLRKPIGVPRGTSLA